MADEPLDPPSRTDAEVELDIRAFLPEGTELDDGPGGDPDEGWGHSAPEPAEHVDLSVLEGIEADLIEVDEALAALDAGEPGRSPLLRRLTQSS